MNNEHENNKQHHTKHPKKKQLIYAQTLVLVLKTLGAKKTAEWMIKQQKKTTRPKKHLDNQKEETKNLKPKKQSHLETQISINVFLNLTPSDEVNLASLTLKKFINLEAQACLNLRPKEA